MIRLLLLLCSPTLSASFWTPTAIVHPSHHAHLRKPVVRSNRYSRIPQGVRRPIFGQLFPSSSSARPLYSSSSSWILPTDHWGNYAALMASASLAQVVGQTTRVGRLLGAPVTAMALTFAAASVGILPPGGSPAAKALQLLAIQLATPLVLLGADLRNVRESCGPLLVSFAVAAMGTIVACLVGWRLVSQPLSHALGADGLKISAALLAKNVGGGINYIAVCRSLGASPTAVAAGLCVDNIFALIYFPITSALANPLPDVVDEPTSNTRQSSNMTSSLSSNDAEREGDAPITTQTMTLALFSAALLIWAGEKLGGQAWALPISSLLTVVVASLAPQRLVRSLRPTADPMGLLALYLFFSTAGAPGLAVASSVRSSLVPIGLFLTSLYSIHGLVLFGCHRILGGTKLQRQKPQQQGFRGAFAAQRLLVASSASIGGPATATALANTAGWRSLVVPSIVVGNIGYAVATFCGIGFYRYFSS